MNHLLVEQRLINEIFNKPPKYLGPTLGRNSPKENCRNKHFIYKVGSRKIVLKRFIFPENALREGKAYDIFGEGLIKVPKKYYSDESVLITDLLESEKPNIKRAVNDWGIVHSKTIGTKVDIDFYYPLKTTLEDLNKNRNLFNHPDKIRTRLSKKPNRKLISLTHGDLYQANILTTKGANYYIDFETFGKSHPARDLSLLLFNFSESSQNILRDYLSVIDFKYDGLEEDIKLFWAERLVRIIIRLKKIITFLKVLEIFTLIKQENS
ncbi:MAG: phosphotransferase [Nanoarchaeota archaeon]|nr:phosphotransferase [Nanoarchaeota archaeon]